MTLSLMVLALTCGSDPAPAPKVIAVAAVNKVDETGQSPWVEITADPILTTLASPSPAKWVAVDDGYKLKAAADGKSAVFAAPKSGRYKLVVVPEQGDPIRVSVVVGKVDPVKPDEPVIPPPPAPVVSELGRKFQVAYALDTRDAAAKASDLADLVELYRQAVELAVDPAVTSTGQLVTRVRDAAKALGITGVADLRRAISAELVAAMPADETLTADLRKTAAGAFAKILSALKEVK